MSADTHDPDLALIRQILDQSKSGKLVLPSPPDWVLKVNTAIQSDHRDSNYIARLIQIDPALVTRIIQVANSPLYRGASNITNCRDALTRMGLKAARNLIFVFALKQGFQPKSGALRKRMEQVWSHSRRVAAISSVLAKNTRGMDPNRALLAGLVHDIGIFPILQNVEQYPDICQDPERLDKIISRLRSPLGTFVLKQWKFDEELAAVPGEAENWTRDSGPKPDYADLVVVAHAQSFFGSSEAYTGPVITGLPAFNKLWLSELGPEASIKVLQEAQMEIDTIIALL